MSRFPIRFERDSILLGRAPGRELPRRDTPDWIGANPERIHAVLGRVTRKPSGGWTVVDASRVLRNGSPRKYRVAGQDLVLWWTNEGPRAAPDACPHMGASLACGRVDDRGRIVCPWHGLALGDRRHGGWERLPAFDDGVLTWVRLASLLTPDELATDAPMLPTRPRTFLDAVIRQQARCEPRDVIANRLDPWHGAHLHAHSFARLTVIDETPTSITVRVVYRIAGRLGMEVDARFDCPDPRTIAMTIIDGEGVGSVVETHASPIDEGRTAIVEATLASSDQAPWLPLGGPLLRRWIARRAARLWDDDVRYCERLYELRASDSRRTADSP